MSTTPSIELGFGHLSDLQTILNGSTGKLGRDLIRAVERDKANEYLNAALRGATDPELWHIMQSYRAAEREFTAGASHSRAAQSDHPGNELQPSNSGPRE